MSGNFKPARLLRLRGNWGKESLFFRFLLWVWFLALFVNVAVEGKTQEDLTFSTKRKNKTYEARVIKLFTAAIFSVLE
jgi:hypothetical protein